MRIEVTQISAAIAIGLGATLVMDVWNVFLKRAFGIPSLNYSMLGRWVLHMPGEFRHASIAKAGKKPGECAAGWLTHYSIGSSLAVAFVLITRGEWLSHPTLVPALLYGLATVVFPLFIMQPAFGLGIASSNAPNPAQARLKSVLTHTVYGLGLYLCARAMS
jgi:hypothetical protein